MVSFEKGQLLQLALAECFGIEVLRDGGVKMGKVKKIIYKIEKNNQFYYNIIEICVMKLYMIEDVLWQKNTLKFGSDIVEIE